MISIECPSCNCEDFDCYDIAVCCDYSSVDMLCYCENCGTQFRIEYIATKVALDE